SPTASSRCSCRRGGGNMDIVPNVGTDEQSQLKQNLAIQALNRGFQNVVRERLPAARTYYVRTDGSDTNSGLANSAAGSFLTLQRAFNVISQTLDIGGQTVTIQVGDGTYTAGIDFSAGTAGGGSIIVSGNLTTPANVVIGVTSNNAFINNGSI